MTPDPGTIVTIAMIAVAGLVWALRLEGRVNTHEKSCEERQKRLDERHQAIGESLETLNAKMDRVIERVAS